MDPRIIAVREEVGIAATFRVFSGSQPVGIVGWEFDCILTRQAGTVDVELEMAADDATDGFRVIEGVSGIYQLRVLPATLQAIPDTTGDFTLLGSIFGTEPGGTRHLIEDLQLNVTKGPGA